MTRRPDEGPAPLLSVLVPVYNEERTVDELLRRVAAGPYPYPEKEILIVDDGSTDRTPERLRPWAGRPGVLLLRHPANRGKGAAVRTALAHARGEFALIQDADLEYDPADYPRLVEPLRRGATDVVYGSRYLRPSRRLPWTRFRLAGWVLNLLVCGLYGRRLTDMLTGYKACRTEQLRALDLRAERFDLEAEITAKVCRLGLRLLEVPIAYRPRRRRDGKKIGWRDGWAVVRTLLRERFAGSGRLSGDAVELGKR